jgi:hypothetical protein
MFMTKDIVTFTIEPTMLKALDKKRGDVPRSVYLRRLIEQDLGR